MLRTTPNVMLLYGGTSDRATTCSNFHYCIVLLHLIFSGWAMKVRRVDDWFRRLIHELDVQGYTICAILNAQVVKCKLNVYSRIGFNSKGILKPTI